jgi:hypothetical protein
VRLGHGVLGLVVAALATSSAQAAGFDEATGLVSLEGAALAIDFENEGGETYICGNPPYAGSNWMSTEQKEDLKLLLDGVFEKWGLLDYVCGWFVKAFQFAKATPTKFAFVATNSVAQGQHVSNFWKPLFDDGLRFFFGVRSFKWSNLAANDAGVTVVIIGGSLDKGSAILFDGESRRDTGNVNAYLLPQPNYWVSAIPRPISIVHQMIKGNYYGLSEHLLMDQDTSVAMTLAGVPQEHIKRFYGSTEVINGKPRYCFWFENEPNDSILGLVDLRARMQIGIAKRSKSKDAVSNGMAKRPHQFREMNAGKTRTFAIPVVSSENRDYLPIDLLDSKAVLSNYFDDADSYARQADALRNDYGQPVEEFEIQFIDGETIDAALADAWGLNQTNFARFFEIVDDWSNDQKHRFIVAVGECGFSFDPATVDPDEFDVDLYETDSLRDLAEQFVDEGLFGDIPKHLANYIDYDAIARDLAMDYSQTEIAEKRLIYACR